MPMNSYGMFGALPRGPIGTGGVFNGQFDNANAVQQPGVMQQKKRWMDGGKFGWKDGLALALGAIGDARTGRPMTSQMILGSMQQRKAQEEALEAEKRAMANQKELLNYKAGLPQAAPKPTEFERTLALAGIDPNSPEGRELARGRAASMAADPNDEFVTVDLGGGRTYQGPRSGLKDVLLGGRPAPQQSAPTPEAIQAEMKRRGLL